jgi:hypothetical protein
MVSTPFTGIIPHRQGRGKKGDDDVKHGTKPTVAQMKCLKAKHLNAENWLIERDTPDVMVIVHRFSNQTRTIHKN